MKRKKVAAARPCSRGILPRSNGVRHSARAGRPYCMSHGGNVMAGRHAKTPKVKGGTPSCATRDRLLAGDLGSTVCGASPHKTGIWGCLFARWGGKFLRLPGFFGSLGVNAQKWVRRRKLTISLKLNLLASHHCADFTVW